MPEHDVGLRALDEIAPVGGGGQEEASIRRVLSGGVAKPLSVVAMSDVSVRVAVDVLASDGDWSALACGLHG